MKTTFRRFLTKGASLLGLLGFAFTAQAASPAGQDWFQIFANPFTGNDDSGDGGTGNPNDLNYYYVGQTFDGYMEINVDSPSGSNASNIWIDYPKTKISPYSLMTGSFYTNWAGQVVSSTIGRIYSTGFNTVGYSSGQGDFGKFTVEAIAPSAANYGTGSPSKLDINTGVIGVTTESNISFDGTDILDDVEDFQFHIWADTKKPYAKNPVPANLATGVAIDSNFEFELRDSKNGEGDDSGVGTGVNTSEPPGLITTDDGGGPVDITAYNAFSCSGIWGTNLCNVSVDPPSPTGIPGDSRNWNYSTEYTVTVSGYRDLASSNQDQLGDTNGPNIMDTKIYTFITEADTDAPFVTAETPVRASTGNPVSTDIVIDVIDLKGGMVGISGSGLNSATCRFNISSASVPLATYSEVSPDVTVIPVAYGYRYTINPPSDFAEGETVSVSAFNCEDVSGNMMVTDNWTFSVSDSNPPYITDESPSNDQSATLNQNITFRIKDDASGIDLANTVIYVNGTYYTNTGGPGAVTTVGTKITFASSLNFNGGNYLGDTTSISGSINNTLFTINPETAFTAGEPVPIVIYTQDTFGNIMERVIYAFAAQGAPLVCPAASSYCGNGTSFDGAKCISSSSGGGSCSASQVYGGVPSIQLSINEQTVSVTPLNEHSALVSWMTSIPATTVIAYDERGSMSGETPYFDFRYSTPEDEKLKLVHSIIVKDLKPGKVYFFKPGGKANGRYASGVERLMALPFQTIEVAAASSPESDTKGPQVICPKPVIVPRPAPAPAPRRRVPSTRTRPRAAAPTTTAPTQVAPALPVEEPTTSQDAGTTKKGGKGFFEIIRIYDKSEKLNIYGKAKPGALLTLTIY